MSRDSSKSILCTVGDLIDAVVELYLTSFIEPFVKFHETFYNALNKLLRQLLDDNTRFIPTWCTANFITYARTLVVLPTLLLLAGRHTILPAVLVILVDFGDFLDGVVARYWVDRHKQETEALKAKDKTSGTLTPRSSSPSNSDDDSFEVVTTGSPHAMLSWVCSHRNRTYGGFVDAVCDKAFVVPCWISLLHVVPASRYLNFWQYTVLIVLILAETASGCVRFQAFFTAGGVSAPSVQGLDFSSSAVKADHVGKAKQTFEMAGTALFMMPVTRYFGLVLLTLAVPLAYESVQRKIKKRVMYVTTTDTKFDHRTLKYWMQVKAMGSKLIVGVANAKATDMVLNACASSAVDMVIAEAPVKADLMFLEKHGIDFVVSQAGQGKFVTDEVINADRCLSVGDDGVARPVKVKSAADKD